MTTDEDREFAKRTSVMIEQNHMTYDRRGCDANHIAKNISYRETLRRGLLAECAWVHEFGGAVRAHLNRYGDGGTDQEIRLMTASGPRLFAVNIKAKSVQVSWEGLRRSGTHLRVPVKEVKPTTIYVFAIYHERTDDAEVMRWDWGATLIRRNERAVYENGNGEQCYTVPFEQLRTLDELKERMMPTMEKLRA